MPYVLDDARKRCSPGSRRISARGSKPIQCAGTIKTRKFVTSQTKRTSQTTLYRKYLAAKRQARKLGLSVRSKVSPTSPALRSAYDNLRATIYYATK